MPVGIGLHDGTHSHTRPTCFCTVRKFCRRVIRDTSAQVGATRRICVPWPRRTRFSRRAAANSFHTSIRRPCVGMPLPPAAIWGPGRCWSGRRASTTPCSHHHSLRLSGDRSREPGDLFDATEIDEILSLHILTLTDEEKQSAAAVDRRRCGPCCIALKRWAQNNSPGCTAPCRGLGRQRREERHERLEPAGSTSRARSRQGGQRRLKAGDAVRCGPWVEPTSSTWPWREKRQRSNRLSKTWKAAFIWR